jgi:hypothetical protein
VELFEYNAFIVRFLAVMEGGTWGASLKQLDFSRPHSSRYPGKDEFASHGAFLLLLFWYKNAYMTTAENLDIIGLYPSSLFPPLFHQILKDYFPGPHHELLG